MKPPAVKLYTIAEANRALAQVRDAVEAVVRLIPLLPDLQEESRLADYKTARRSDDAALEVRYQEARRALWDGEMELTKALARLEELGVVLKDPNTGLIDFYSDRDGETVELCWKLGEDSVAHWHRIGDGFAGRQPL